ncbi:PEP/pyruvate-binding domain-containing protein [Endozoicomonas sp. SCSIO W0465]|uniref:PEP/pyruvate-binding domain-containing protein n=1 Tax=Endozoicomonas sp. SCSIO W0465 TaxID=2918516 RepID=UPI00207589DD|nr:PEP/pyruvate-binding domain-containing protein [Endozoicomonas sp. SCSIO W0465]USE35939.1 DUF4116 domain-containing protein [Endozoicomonas sp. SCSIO W0465]
MLQPPVRSDAPYSADCTANPDHNTEASKNSGKRHGSQIGAKGSLDTAPLNKRFCRILVSAPLDPAADYSLLNREQLGGKGMFLRRMQEAGLPIPPFKCVTAQVMNALEQHPLDMGRLAPYLSGIAPGMADEAGQTSLANIRDHLNTLPPSDQAKRDSWLTGLSTFIASDDFYQQVKDSEAARHIRDQRRQLDELSPSQPVIVRSSGINEDNYGDAQAGKYRSEVQGEDDVLRTCLKVMASGYRPEVCPEGGPQPMALIIQHCIDCHYGGVVMSYQSLQDDTVRVEYTSGQPRGAVAGQSGTIPHRIGIDRKAGADNAQYFPGTISSHFVLQKNTDNNGYSETEIQDADTQSDGSSQQLSDGLVAELREAVTKLEDLLLCPVDVEFAIDRQGCLFLLQVRPITRLSGGMDFALSIPKPEETLASGEGASEGYCAGPLWVAKNRAADTLPEGAIVVAQHGEEWMLEPERLERAAGFVFAAGGTNDHVAITLRQAEKPCLLAGDQYPAVAAQDSLQATLACARFNGSPGAFVVAGDLTGKLASHRSASSAFSDVPLVEAAASRDDLLPPEGTLSQVATAFHWLTDQNARLLAFFAPGGGLDCLANPIKLSMSAQRSEMLAATQTRTKQLIQGAEALLDGYRAFLLLAGDSHSPLLKSLRDELPQLMTRFETLKQTIGSGLERITLPLRADEERPVSPETFRQWVADCHQLQSCLQALNPRRAKQVRSVHDLIFALHQRFIKALGPVTLASGQGTLFKKGDITYVDCLPPGEDAGLMKPSCKTHIEKLVCIGTVVNMVDALIVNLALGHHTSIIELLEHAEGGKERTLRLKFSDSFNESDGNHKSGKLKRMWLLVQLLKAIELDKNADGMKLGFNAVAGEIIVECPQMTSRQAMQDAFAGLITVLRGFTNLDLTLDELPIFEGDQWSFDLLAQRLDSDFSAGANRFAFRLCLFLLGYSFSRMPFFYSSLSKHHQQFIDRSRWLAACWRKSEGYLREILMSDEIDESTRNECLHYLLFLRPEIATPVIEHIYGHLKNKYFVLKPSYRYRLEFAIPPDQLLPENKEKITDFLQKHGLRYASQSVRNDKDMVLPAIAARPRELVFVSEELKRDKEVVMAAVTRYGEGLEYASPELQDDDEVVMAAIVEDSRALVYASERVRSNKKIVQMAMDDKIGIFKYASKKLQNDRQYLLELIEKNAQIFTLINSGLEYDEEFIRSAIQINPKVYLITTDPTS